MITNLDDIQKRLKAGQTEEARSGLLTLLRTDPQNADAWAMLATLFDDPARQVDCYRQVLRIDPGNQQADDRLRVLTGQSPEISPQEQVSQEQEAALRCPQCGGAMEVRHIGEMQDKRAVCLYCHTEIDLPDTFRRVSKKRTHEQRRGDSRTVEETIIETRRDGQISAENPTTLPPEVQEVLQILKEKGPKALDEELLSRLQARGISISFDPESFDPETLQALQKRGYLAYGELPLGHTSKTVLIRTEHHDKSFVGRLLPRIDLREQKSETSGMQAVSKSASLSPDDIITLAGGALSPEESRKCPHPECDAVISKDATRCPWCGKPL